MFLLHQILLTTFMPFIYGDENAPLVRVSNGWLRGNYEKTINQFEYMSFMGVPYARPPIAQLRFADPVPLGAWPGTWIANQSISCINLDNFDDENARYGITGVEDCLYLNVYVPRRVITKRDNRDVIVFIHGGGFNFGAAYVYNPQNIVENEAIFVTFNYRLGLLGFLSTEDATIPGNMGLKDQQVALHWIKQNIKYFGGNADSITLTGHSAGGASVQFHTMSPLSRGLFARGISISGCALNPWTFQEDARRKALQVGAHLGCDFPASTRLLLECLRTRTASEITEATRMFRPWLYNPFSPVSAVVDKWSRTPFLPEHPYSLLLGGKIADVPWMASSTTAEGLYAGAEYIKYDRYLDELNNNWGTLASAVLDYNGTIPLNHQANLSHIIKEHYLGAKPINKDSYDQLIKMVGDRLYLVDLETATKLHSKAIKSPVHYYVYNYTTQYREGTVTYILANTTTNYGVGHGDDMILILKPKKGQLDEEDTKMTSYLVNMWISFAKTSKFNSAWQPVSKSFNTTFNYLTINAPNAISSAINANFGDKAFWSQIPFKENANYK